ncbi:hypothetical protein PS662_05450 [Pseudomonas fluorescens]|uniref:Uncharacterized protein n=1 Tax=Pseudomonas fluorescens TaxID=294 RepID=A0A5E6XLD1_PSEFL|nr:hypothetical protein PS662_05450 [Pseudomonas fluorescens]
MGRRSGHSGSNTPQSDSPTAVVFTRNNNNPVDTGFLANPATQGAGLTRSLASQLPQGFRVRPGNCDGCKPPSSERRPEQARSHNENCANPNQTTRPSVSSPCAFDPAFDFDLPAPSGGRVEVLRSGQPGMDAGLAAPGHGWPMAAGPRSRTGARERRALARGRTPGRSVLLTFGRLQK